MLPCCGAQVIMSGTSAGGLTTYLHAEYFRTMMHPSTKLYAVPDAGFFLDLPNTQVLGQC